MLFCVWKQENKEKPDYYSTDFIQMKSVVKTFEEDAAFVRLKGDPTKIPSKSKPVIGFGRSNKHEYHQLSWYGLMWNGKF